MIDSGSSLEFVAVGVVFGWVKLAKHDDGALSGLIGEKRGSFRLRMRFSRGGGRVESAKFVRENVLEAGRASGNDPRGGLRSREAERVKRLGLNWSWVGGGWR